MGGVKKKASGASLFIVLTDSPGVYHASESGYKSVLETYKTEEKCFMQDGSRVSTDGLQTKIDSVLASLKGGVQVELWF